MMQCLTHLGAPRKVVEMPVPGKTTVSPVPASVSHSQAQEQGTPVGSAAPACRGRNDLILGRYRLGVAELLDSRGRTRAVGKDLVLHAR